MKLMCRIIYDELTEEYNVKKLMFFGDFNGSAIEKLPKLEKLQKMLCTPQALKMV